MNKSLRLFIVFIVCVTASSFLNAEYRAYQYEVRPAEENRNERYIVTSTLNPTSFPAYHGGGAALKITLLKSWMCMGYTGGYQDFCPSPQNEFVQKQEQQEELP